MHLFSKKIIKQPIFIQYLKCINLEDQKQQHIEYQKKEELLVNH